MKEIKLTQGKIALVDDEDYDVLKKYKWSATKNGCCWYARTSVGPRKNLCRLYMHRVILGINKSHLLVDHKDGDTLNNQRDNLRACTKAENNRNKKPKIGKDSIYCGVRKNRKNWTGYIRTNLSKHQITKTFTREDDAAKWYNEKAREFYGEFAYQNQIQP
jgi:hypothetical protein